MRLSTEEHLLAPRAPGTGLLLADLARSAAERGLQAGHDGQRVHHRREPLPVRQIDIRFQHVSWEV